MDMWPMVPSVNDVALTGPGTTNPWPRGPNHFGGYQLDARVGTLQEQALGALLNHAQIQTAPPPETLDDLAASSASCSPVNAFAPFLTPSRQARRRCPMQM